MATMDKKMWHSQELTGITLSLNQAKVHQVPVLGLKLQTAVKHTSKMCIEIMEDEVAEVDLVAEPEEGLTVEIGGALTP
jgi:hypothetical protein